MSAEFSEFLQDPEINRLLFSLLSGGAAALIGVLIVQSIFEWFSPSRHRIKQLVSPSSKKQFAQRKLIFKQIILTIAQWFTPSQGKEVARIRSQLEYIGYDQPNVLKLFFGAKFLLGGIAATGVYFFSHFFPDYSPSRIAIACGVAGFIALLIPNKILEYLVDKRLNTYRKGFPDSLDLLLVCVEAGLGLNAAIQRVSKELAISHPQLSEHYAIVNEEIRVGVDRVKALNNFARRTRLEDAENLVSLLSQSMKYGTSVADTLRVFAAELRDKRIQNAEEQAAMVGTKLIFPLVLCIFPSFFLVIVGPAVLGVMKALAE